MNKIQIRIGSKKRFLSTLLQGNKMMKIRNIYPSTSSLPVDGMMPMVILNMDTFASTQTPLLLQQVSKG